jgi:hypothetical protein
MNDGAQTGAATMLLRFAMHKKRNCHKKEIIRVEPLATHHEPGTGEIFGDSFVMAICLAI